MKNEHVNFFVGAALLAPLCAAEDLLRMAGVKVHDKGLMYNDDGKSVMEIWRECKPAPQSI